MKSIAVFLGYGPDVDFVLDNPNIIPSEAVIFRVNTRGLREDPHGLCLVDPINWGPTKAVLSQRNMLNAVTLGSFKIRIADIRPFRKTGSIGRLAGFLPYAASGSDERRLFIMSQLEPEVQFPAVFDVFPNLFATDDVSIRADPNLCSRVLNDPQSYKKDACFMIGEEVVKVFRAPRGKGRDVITRRLDPKKLREIHLQQNAQYYFFDRKRTTVVGLDEMKTYANDNKLTLQSFNDDD